MTPLKLRRIALKCQGLSSRQPFGRGLSATRRAIRHLGYVQIDTISVVARAHNHVLHSRVPNFQADHLLDLLSAREIFEARFPVAAFRPTHDYRFTLLHARHWRSRDLAREDRAMMQRVRSRIRERGAMRSRDFSDQREGTKGWWNWKPTKRALEQLFFQGDLMISARDGFEKSYDLTERVLPRWVDTTPPSPTEFANYLIDTTLGANGFASYKQMASGARFGVSLGSSLRQALDERCASGALSQALGPGGKPLWFAPELMDAPVPRTNRRARLLSPFDNALTHRERILHTFGFDYQIECFVPQASRRFGYYCLPLLFGDRLVGRMDCKSHRSQSRFEVKALFLEPEFEQPARAAELEGPIARAVTEYARFEGCDHAQVTHSQPPWFAAPLNAALRASD